MRTALRRDAIKEADVVTGATKGEKGEDEDQEFNNLFFLSLSLFSEVLLDMWAVSRPLRQMQRNVGYETRYFPSPKMPSRSIVLGRSQFVFTEKWTFPNSNPCYP